MCPRFCPLTASGIQGHCTAAEVNVPKQPERAALFSRSGFVCYCQPARNALAHQTFAWLNSAMVVNFRILYNVAQRRGTAALTRTAAGDSSRHESQRRKQQARPQAGARRGQAPRNLRDPRDRRDAAHGRPLRRLLGRHGRPHSAARSGVRRSNSQGRSRLRNPLSAKPAGRLSGRQAMAGRRLGPGALQNAK